MVIFHSYVSLPCLPEGMCHDTMFCPKIEVLTMRIKLSIMCCPETSRNDQRSGLHLPCSMGKTSKYIRIYQGSSHYRWIIPRGECTFSYIFLLVLLIFPGVRTLQGCWKKHGIQAASTATKPGHRSTDTSDWPPFIAPPQKEGSNSNRPLFGCYYGHSMS